MRLAKPRIVVPPPAPYPASAQVHDLLARLVARGVAANDFDELHHRHRVHEVHANHLVGRPVAAAMRVMLMELVLVARMQPGAAASRSAKSSASSRRFLWPLPPPIRRGPPQRPSLWTWSTGRGPLLCPPQRSSPWHHAVHVFANGGKGAFEGICRAVHHDHVVARLCEDVGNAIAHRACSNDGDLHVQASFSEAFLAAASWPPPFSQASSRPWLPSWGLLLQEPPRLFGAERKAPLLTSRLYHCTSFFKSFGTRGRGRAQARCRPQSHNRLGSVLVRRAFGAFWASYAVEDVQQRHIVVVRVHGDVGEVADTGGAGTLDACHPTCFQPRCWHFGGQHDTGQACRPLRECL